jgi:hypothetical protein
VDAARRRWFLPANLVSTLFLRKFPYAQKSTVYPTSESPFDDSGHLIGQFLRSLQYPLDPDNFHLAGRDLSGSL